MKNEKINNRLELRITESELKAITTSALINSPKPSGGGNVNKETRELIKIGLKYRNKKSNNCVLCGCPLSDIEKEGGNCCDSCWLRH